LIQVNQPKLTQVSRPTSQAPKALSTKKILDEDIGKFEDFGLSYAICSLLSSQGLYTVGGLVEKLNSIEPGIKGVGEVRRQNIYKALLQAGLRQGPGGKWS
jgi:hypothetical protein